MNNKVDLTQLTLAELSVISALLKKTITLFLHKLRNTDFIVFNSIIYIYKYIYIFFHYSFCNSKENQLLQTEVRDSLLLMWRGETGEAHAKT